MCVADACDQPVHAKNLCKSHYEKARYAANPERWKYTPDKLARHYDRKRERYERAVGRSKPATCEACGTAAGLLGIVYDHCHVTGRGRGWLCSNCNTALGLLSDSPAKIEKLKEYAERYA